MDSNYVVLQVNNRQYIVKNGDTLKIDRISVDAPVSILLANIDEKLMIGKPIAENAGVKLEITKQVKDKKINVSRFRNKSRYRRNKGFRQNVSFIKVLEINNSGKVLITESKELVKIDILNEKPLTEGKKGNITENKNPIDKKTEDLRNVSELEISDRMIEDLNKAGYMTVSDLKKAKKEDLKSIKGLGEKSVDKLYEQIS